jgi:uncharacterized protein YifE (UPF0438 family)
MTKKIGQRARLSDGGKRQPASRAQRRWVAVARGDQRAGLVNSTSSSG